MRFQPDAARFRAENFRRGFGAALIQEFRGIGVQHWRLPPGLAVDQAIRTLKVNPMVEIAEPNYLVYEDAIPNDPRFGELWGLHNTGQLGGTPDADIDAPEAWDLTQGSNTVLVAVVDTGVEYTHQDLAGNIWSNPAEANGITGFDDDGNGYVDDLRGWDFVNDDNDPMDDRDHGTHVSGTIGARANNGKGVAGVSWNVKIMPLKFLNSSGTGTTANAIRAILYAASFRDGGGNTIARVHNYSWGGGAFSLFLEDAIRSSGAVVCASAGNSGSDSIQYPAGYSAANLISVAATDRKDAKASFSSYGSDWVDLGAPGVDILSTILRSKYGLKSGTSMAAPHVAGVAALILALYPASTNAEVKDRILLGADPVASLAGITVTGGRLNAYGALTVAPPPADAIPPAAVTDLQVKTDPQIGDLITMVAIDLTCTAPGDDGSAGTAFRYDVRYSTSPIVSDADFAAATPALGEPAPQPSGSAESFFINALQPGTTYHIAMKALDEAGNASPLSNAIAAATDASGGLLSVADLWVSFSYSGGYQRKPFTYVLIQDELGYPVDSASVKGNWSGCLTGIGSGVTWIDGWTGKIEHPRSYNCQNSSCTFNFTANNVTHAFVPWDGVPLTDSIWCF